MRWSRQCYKFADIFNLTRAIVSHGEENLHLNRVDEQGRPSAFTEEVKIGVIKFDNGSRIIAFSANPQAMSVYGGDVGLDKFAKHPNARLLWETAQARVTWNYDLAIWSSHDGEDTLFNEFAQEARAAAKAGQAHAPLGVVAAGVSPAVEPGIMPGGFLSSSSAALPYQPTASRAARTPPSTSGETPDATLNTCERENLGQSVGAEGRGEVAVPPSIANQTSKIENPHSPWNLYFRITLPDAIGFGLVDAINQARGTNISPQQFLGDCRARARDEEIFEQSYMCNPIGAAANRIVEWSAIERCRSDYEIDRLHLETDEVQRRFGEFNPSSEHDREYQIGQFLRSSFPSLFANSPIKKSKL